MKFSIVIPTYNRADFIDKTIESLLKQSFMDFEIIVVDDGSTDNTQTVVEQIKDERVFYYKKDNAERGAARNFGANKSKGDYINFFDSDDLAYENHLQVAFDTIQNNNAPAVFHLGFDIKYPDGAIARPPTKVTAINKQLIYGNVMSCNGVFVKKEIALKNPFSEIRELSASEDYLLWLQLASQHTILNNNTITSTIIEHDQRSVLSINKDALIKRKTLMLKLALEDNNINMHYNQQLNQLKLNTYSYIALHLIMAKEKKAGLEFLSKSVQTDFTYMFSKRFIATIKHLIF